MTEYKKHYGEIAARLYNRESSMLSILSNGTVNYVKGPADVVIREVSYIPAKFIYTN